MPLLRGMITTSSQKTVTTSACNDFQLLKSWHFGTQ